MVRVNVGVEVLVIVVVGLAGGVQEFRRVGDGVIFEEISVLTAGDREAGLRGEMASAVSERLDMKRVRAAIKTRIDRPKMPSITGRAYRGVVEGVAMSGISEV